MRISNFKFQISNSGLIMVFLLLICVALFITAASAATWGGVDEAVVEKYAEEHGRTARDPLLNTDQGDLLLFVFLLAGAAGGFIGGYYWRQLTEPRNKRNNKTRKFEGVQGSSK